MALQIEGVHLNPNRPYAPWALGGLPSEYTPLALAGLSAIDPDDLQRQFQEKHADASKRSVSALAGLKQLTRQMRTLRVQIGSAPTAAAAETYRSQFDALADQAKALVKQVVEQRARAERLRGAHGVATLARAAEDAGMPAESAALQNQAVQLVSTPVSLPDAVYRNLPAAISPVGGNSSEAVTDMVGGSGDSSYAVQPYGPEGGWFDKREEIMQASQFPWSAEQYGPDTGDFRDNSFFNNSLDVVKRVSVGSPAEAIMRNVSDNQSTKGAMDHALRYRQGLQRMVGAAVKTGYDGVGTTPGGVSADDLSGFGDDGDEGTDWGSIIGNVAKAATAAAGVVKTLLPSGAQAAAAVQNSTMPGIQRALNNAGAPVSNAQAGRVASAINSTLFSVGGFAVTPVKLAIGAAAGFAFWHFVLRK